jgi:ABC-type phosphate/phosphonate transport system substrate-binding protein
MKSFSVGRKIARTILFFTVALFALGQETAAAGVFKIGIMQAQAGAAKKYELLETYLLKENVQVKFVPFSNYKEAAQLFAKGDVDGMFSGSGVAGAFILKGLVKPLVRPVDNQGRSTYWAVIVGRKGEKPFTGDAAYFLNRRVTFSAMASSGEFYYRALPGVTNVSAQTSIAGNHQIAIEKLNRGEADFAIIKNTVWDSLKNKYPELAQVGQDGGQNPNETLIISNKTSPETIKGVLIALLSVEKDPAAAAVREAMAIKGFQLTTTNDFAHTLSLLKRAGVTTDYDLK